jgi:hypothetical protein
MESTVPKPKKILKKKPFVPVEPDWARPVEFRYTVAFNKKAWRKVHPPHLAAALAAGEAAIRAHLNNVSPYPYSVAEVDSSGWYGSLMWDSSWEDDDAGLEEIGFDDE